MNIYHLFQERTVNAGPFILSQDLEVLCTYQMAHVERARYAAQLLDLGVKSGDRVIVQVEKSKECIYLYFACLSVGAIYVPLNTAYLKEELQYFVADATPALIVCDPSQESFFTDLGSAQVVTLSGQGAGTLNSNLPAVNDFPVTQSEPEDTAVILYTSGTTGRPKGAMISHGNLAANALTLSDAWQWQSTDVMLHALPIFHIHGLFVATHLPVLNGSPIILLPSFDPNTVIDLLPSATVYMGVPTNYTRLIASGRLTHKACSKMRLFTSGSAPLLETTFREFAQRSGHEIVERYGMTETGMNTSNPLSGPRKPGTVGPPLPGVETRIVDPAGESVDANTPGALEVRGPNVFSGYWQLPEKTKEEFTVDGYFKTGDVAQMDTDSYVAIVGRDKDMIISGGLNIYPKEIEGLIDKMNGINECAVIGLPHPDFGEGVCAIIVKQSGTDISAIEVTEFVKDRLANFKVPKWVYFIDALPRNTMGKVQKNKLRETYTQN